MKCLRCQHENPPQSRFCFECGARFAPTCSGCGAELPAGVKFCNQCGQAAGGQLPANPRLVSPETYTPKHLAEKILTSKSALEPSLRTMFLVSRTRLAATGVTAEDSVRWAKDVGATDLGIDHNLVDAAVVAAARAAGVKVSVWTVNEEADLRRMRELGAEVVITDRPDLARRVYGRPPR